MDYKVTIIRSSRKTISLEVKSDLTIVVRAPYSVSDRKIKQFVKEKEDWLEKAIQRQQERQEQVEDVKKMTASELRKLAAEAVKYIPDRVAYYAEKMHISYGRITIRNQKTRWGSCSGKGNLNFNCLLMLAPGDVLDYVVIHELCHRREMNHSKKFWDLVAAEMPDYKDKKKWLKIHGDELMKQMP